MVSCVPASRRRGPFINRRSLVLHSHRPGGPESAGTVAAQTAVQAPQTPPQAPASARSSARSFSDCDRSSSRFVTPTARGSPRSSRGSRSGRRRRDPGGRRRTGAGGSARTRAAAARRAYAGSRPGAGACAGGPRRKSQFRPAPPAPEGRPVPAGLRQRGRQVEGLQPRHRGHRQLRRRRRAGTTIDPLPALSLDEAEVSFQAVVDPYARADFFLAASPEGLEVEEGFLTFPTLPGGLLVKVGKLKAQFGKVNTHARPRPAVGRPAARHEEPAGRRRGTERCRLLGLAADSEPGDVPRGDGGGLQGPRTACSPATAQRSRPTSARLRGYRDLTEGTNLDLGTSFAYGHNDARPDATTRLVRRRRDHPLPSAAPRHLQAVHRPHRAVLEPAG